MDLRKFYLDNITPKDYYYKFFEHVRGVNEIYNFFSGVEEVNNFSFDIYDTEDAIAKFKNLIQPGNEKNKSIVHTSKRVA